MVGSFTAAHHPWCRFCRYSPSLHGEDEKWQLSSLLEVHMVCYHLSRNYWGVAKGSSVSWVAKFKGGKKSAFCLSFLIHPSLVERWLSKAAQSRVGATLLTSAWPLNGWAWQATAAKPTHWEFASWPYPAQVSVNQLSTDQQRLIGVLSVNLLSGFSNPKRKTTTLWGGHPIYLKGSLLYVCVANPSTPYRGQNPRNREKKGFGVKKFHFPVTQRRVLWVRKSPSSLWCPVEKWGFFWPQAPLSRSRGNGSLLTPRPSFPDLGISTPVGGRRIRNVCMYICMCVSLSIDRSIDLSIVPFSPSPTSETILGAGQMGSYASGVGRI